MKQPKMRKGAVMMEYVILAVMIAAAALVAIIYFGRTITSQAQSASMATAGNSKGSSEQSKEIKEQNARGQKWIEEGQKHAEDFNDREGLKK